MPDDLRAGPTSGHLLYNPSDGHLVFKCKGNGCLLCKQFYRFIYTPPPSDVIANPVTYQVFTKTSVGDAPCVYDNIHSSNMSATLTLVNEIYILDTDVISYFGGGGPRTYAAQPDENGCPPTDPGAWVQISGTTNPLIKVIEVDALDNDPG